MLSELNEITHVAHCLASSRGLINVCFLPCILYTKTQGLLTESKKKRISPEI